ncbi:hypothetical protein HFP89_07675 [Wenzhouxiangella sp. XN79A]|uniref:oxygen-dependent tRNA uridine(34) hydroxylase TrhO n=1 Tax=Wenzhouxiangella sp. XN79A TaxID=2724193 RepID=UPI00144ADA63|nr:rhodanese-like domain-containing protein [Wenzhouxiangella sp. XN79A]NKI35042.1 hypothetical protein [Wenzhouxiangella sp. XN79A]
MIASPIDPAESQREPALQLIAGYEFRPLDKLQLTRERVRKACQRFDLLGTVLLAPEGINFSLSGSPAALDRWLGWLAGRLGVDAPLVNRQAVDARPFRRLKVRVKPEIVTFDPATRPTLEARGRALDPLAFNELLARDDVQLVDTRNHYEYAIGSFDGAIDPGTASFTEFKDWAREHLDRARPVAMFCTGGIRCEKASLWMAREGFDQVFQLHGGILGYLAKVPADQSRWRGECFVFDDRVSVDAEMKPTGRIVCIGCRRPAEGLDPVGLPPIENGRCAACGDGFDAARLASLRERARQVALAAERGASHLGPDAQP